MLKSGKQPRLLLKLAAAAALGVAALCPAEVPQHSERSRPTLANWGRELKSLYNDVQTGLVQVQLPTPQWAIEQAEKANPLRNEQLGLNEDMKKALAAQRERAKKGHVQPLDVAIAATAPSSKVGAPTTVSVDGWKAVRSGSGDVMVLESGGTTAIRINTGGERTAGGIRPAAPPVAVAVPATDFAPNNAGLLIDDRGHFLVPVAVEKEVAKDGIKVVINGTETRARFVGSDLATNISVFKVDQPADKPLGQPLPLSVRAPEMGDLVLVISPNSGRAYPVLWTNQLQDAGIVANIDGSVAGFVRFGRFFSAAAARPVVDQLIQQGKVDRPVLGLSVEEVTRTDPARKKNTVLADQPALRIHEVQKASVADEAGLRPGDLIFKLGSDPVGDKSTFAAFLSAHADRTSLQIIREGATRTVTLNFSRKPATTRE